MIRVASIKQVLNVYLIIPNEISNVSGIEKIFYNTASYVKLLWYNI